MSKVDYTYQSNAHIKRVAKYQQMLERFFDDATSEFCRLFGKAKYDDSKQFFFEDYPTLKKKADSVVSSLSSSIYDVILTGTSAEWKKSNEITDQMVKELFKSRGADIDKIKNSDVVDLFNNHDKALDAFQKRKINGLSLSDKVWNMAEYHRLETQLALSIEKGESAAELARKVKKCLNEPDKLFRRVRDKYGELRLSKNAKSYHPGAGAYRSSVRNAQRLARTEINMAYREAEMQRFNELDFIVGFEVKRSTHPYPCDICESHKGKYPKDFKFNGWHPNCRCYVIPILNTQEEFDKQSEAILNGESYSSSSSNEVFDLPAGFKKWFGDNLGRIDRATEIGTLPYYMRDNRSYVNAVRQQVTAQADGNLMQDLAEDVAKMIGAKCTPINYKSLPSMMRKCKADGCLPSDLKDTVRTTIVTSSQEDIEKAIRALETDSGKLNLLRVKRQSTDVGYTGVICNFELPNGVVCEIQINTAEMIYAKEAPEIAKMVIGEDVWQKIFKRTGLEGGLGHKYYEEFRLLDATSSKAAEIANKSREYYSHFQSSNIVNAVSKVTTPSPVVNPVSKSIVDNVQSTLTPYEASMYKQSSVMSKLLDELYSPEVQKGDEKYRLDLINKIKEKAAVLTRYNLRKAKVVDGLEYVGLKRNTSFYGGGSLKVTKTGEIVHTKELKKDVLVYMDNSGISYYFPIGSRESNVPFSAVKASRIIDAFPPGMKETIKGMLLDTGKHPLDAFYIKEYSDFKFGYMYSGEIVSVHAKILTEKEFERLITHEVGHNLDGGISLSSIWKDAVKKDGVYPSTYSEKSLSEDFAESFSIAYIIGFEKFESKYPNRWNVMKDLFDKVMNKK